jgi:hypothetical protein
MLLILGILSVVSFAFVFIKREKYTEKLSCAFCEGEKIRLTLPAVALFTVCIWIAVVSVL